MKNHWHQILQAKCFLVSPNLCKMTLAQVLPSKIPFYKNFSKKTTHQFYLLTNCISDKYIEKSNLLTQLEFKILNLTGNLSNLEQRN